MNAFTMGQCDPKTDHKELKYVDKNALILDC